MTFFSRFFGEDAAHVIFDQEQNQFYYDTSVGRWRQRGMEHFEEDEDWKPRPRETVQAATEKTPVEELMTPPRVYGTHLLDLRDRAEKLKSPNGGTARKVFAAELTSDMHVASDSERATEPPNSPSLTEASEEPDLEVPTLTRSVAMVREDDEQFSMLLPTLQESSTANAKVYAQVCASLEKLSFDHTERQAKIIEAGGLKHLLVALERFQEELSEQLPILELLWSLSFNSAMSQDVAPINLVSAFKALLRSTKSTGDLQAVLCGILLNLSVNENIRQELCHFDLLELICSALRCHPSHCELQVQGCQFLYQLASQPELRPCILAAGALEATKGCGSTGSADPTWGRWLQEILLC